MTTSGFGTWFFPKLFTFSLTFCSIVPISCSALESLNLYSLICLLASPIRKQNLKKKIRGDCHHLRTVQVSGWKTDLLCISIKCKSVPFSILSPSVNVLSALVCFCRSSSSWFFSFLIWASSSSFSSANFRSLTSRHEKDTNLNCSANGLLIKTRLFTALKQFRCVSLFASWCQWAKHVKTKDSFLGWKYLCVFKSSYGSYYR